MANPNKFTAKEVLNKVLLDSSGNAVTANSVTSQEALNSVLDTTNNRLNMSLAGGTISGDVTISGDLTVNGSATNSYDEIVNGDLHVKSDSGNSTSAFLVEQNDGTDVFVVDTNNLRVGIGIAPVTNLDVASPVSTDVTVFPTLRLTNQTGSSDWDNGDVNGAFEFYTNDTSGNAPYPSAFIKSINEQENGTLPSGSLSFGTATYNAVGGATERMRLDSNGRLGIGVSPSYPLHVENSADTVAYFKSTDNNGQIAVVDDDTTAYFGANGSRAFMGTASGLAGTTNLVVDSSGNVGIGDTSPEARVTVTPSTVGTTSLGGRSINYGLNINTSSGRSGVTVKPTNNYAIGDDNAGFQWLYPFDDGGNGDFKAFRVSEGATLVDKFYATRDGQGYFAGDVTISKSGNAFLNITSTGGGARMKLTGQADETTNGILFYETTNVRGQINYNHADQKMEFKTGDSNTLALTLASDQQATFSNHINLGDDVKALFGDSNDLQLYHNGTHSYINEAGTGNLIIYQGSNTAIFSPTSITLERDTTVSGDVNIKSIGGNNDPATLALWSPDVSIADNDNIGVILAQGSDSGGSPPYLGAKIEFNADAVWDTGTTGYYPTRIDFFTESNSGTVSTASPAFTIDSNQNATFAGTITATSASDNVAKFESSDAIARVVIEDSDSENNGNWIAVQNDVMSFATNGSNTALTLDSSQDATFAGNIVVSSGVIQLADLAQSIDFIQSGAINYDSNNDQTGRVFSIGHNRSAGSSGGTTNFVLDENSRISLSNNDGGSNNTVFGYKAGNAIASGTEGNVIIGHNAGLVLNGGDQNVAIGADALKAGTTGIGNTVVGTSAGDSATSQDNLVLIGKDAGGSINHIDSNGTTAIGTSALTLLTNGRQNTAVGYGALETTANGDRNTAVGHLALGNVTGGNDGDNTAIGHNAGHDGTNDLTDGTENTLIGSSTRVSSASAVNQTVIGYNAVGVGDNSVVLGDSDVTDVYMASDSGATVHCAKIQMLNYRIIQKDFGALSSGSSHDIGTANANFAGTIKMWTNHNSGSGYIEYSLVYSTNAKALSLIHQNQPYAPSTVTLSLDTSTGTISTSSLSYNTDVHIVIESMNTQFTFA